MSIRWKLVFSGYAVFAILSFTVVTAFTTKPVAAKTGTQDRPSLADEQTYGDERFFIHYTLSGNDAVDSTDLNNNSVPDYVEQVLDALNTSYQTEVVQLGWAPPPDDLGEGGDTRFDVYLEELMAEGIAGYADSEGGYLGDNPSTPEIERRAAYSYLSVDNDFTEVLEDIESDETPLELLQATAAHEFNHAIQAGYDAFDPQAWLYEATASWMEDEVFDGSNDTVYYIEDIFDAPDQCRVAEEGWYGSWLFLRLMSERYGQDVVRSIWEHSRQLDGLDAIDAALVPYGSSLLLESRDFAVANLLRTYEEGAAYPTIRLEGLAEQDVFMPLTGVQSLGSDTVQIQRSGVVTVTLASNEAVLYMRAVGVRGNQADVTDAESNSLTINLDAYQAVYVIVHNDARTSREELCADVDYSIDIVPSNLPLTTVTTVWPAGNFQDPTASPRRNDRDLDHNAGSAPYRPPMGQPFTGSDFVEEPLELDVPFSPVLPVALPSGYTFDYAYTMTAGDFGSSAIYYVPGGGISANYDYIDESGNWLSIAQSPSPYETLQDWLNGINYFNVSENPGKLQSISGVEILMEDLSNGSDTRISITFILDGLFIVVDGDHSAGDATALAEYLIAARVAQPAATVSVPILPTGIVPTSSRALPGKTILATIGGMGLTLCGLATCLMAGMLPLVAFFIRQSSKKPHKEQ
ncbi:MAG: hypothetical protein JXB30_16800 [Anaerolineae bacterium]|nr:hypothetical protein [Anaerolineae bacterium]